MSHENIIRAWKDETFRDRLSDIERASLPENPAGLVELTDAEIEAVGGMTGTKCGTWTDTIGCTNTVPCGRTKAC